MCPSVPLAGQDRNPIAMKVLAILEVFQIQPCLQKIFWLHIFSNRDMWLVVSVFHDELFENVMYRIFINDIKVYSAMITMMKSMSSLKAGGKGLTAIIYGN